MRLGGDVCSDPLCKFFSPFESVLPQPHVETPFSQYDEDFQVGACCDVDHPDYQASKLASTAFNDCAARTCALVWDLLYSPDYGLKLPVGAAPSLSWYRSLLQDPGGFQECTRALIKDGSWSKVYPKNEQGALKKLVVYDFECGYPVVVLPDVFMEDLDCSQVLDPSPIPAEWPPQCTENPNWVLGATPLSDYGAGSPVLGEVTFDVAGIPPHFFSGTRIAYRRAPCDGQACAFVLDDLDFTLDDVTWGPLVFHTPNITLIQDAYGSQTGDFVTLAEGTISLRIETSMSVKGKSLFDGSPVPLYVSNTGEASFLYDADEETLEILHMDFKLPQGVVARLRMQPTPCPGELP